MAWSFGINQELKVVETIEVKNHPWFIASQSLN